ncbi:MAG: hypothetical protein ACLU4P_10045 [Ruminococcus sp.]
MKLLLPVDNQNRRFLHPIDCNIQVVETWMSIPDGMGRNGHRTRDREAFR